MSTVTIRHTGEKLYRDGLSLFQEGLYGEALIELRRAEDIFRREDAHGHPFSRHLANGISGLANTLALSGRCHQQLGDCKAALTSYESSMINSKFESKRAMHEFKKNLSEDMVRCYETLIKAGSNQTSELLHKKHDIDISFRFPYSLSPDIIPFARLYELAPERYPQHKQFYENAAQRDAEIRRQSRTTDESTLKRTGFYVWGILAAIWLIYGLITMNALVHP